MEQMQFSKVLLLLDILYSTGRFLVFALTAGGCVCSALAALSCEFFSYESIDPTMLPPPYTNQANQTVGLFSYYDETGSCLVYDKNFVYANDDYDIMFVTAQFAALVGPGCAALAWIVNILEWLFWSHPCTYFTAFTLLFVAFVAQGLTFLVYGQNEFW